MKYSVLQIACSDYARAGTIGFRVFKINSHIDASSFRVVICRSGPILITKTLCVIPIYPIKFIAYFFAFLRVHLGLRYNFRRVEVFLFALLSLPLLVLHSFIFRNSRRVAHCWDHSGMIFFLLNKFKYNTIFDLCIAPAIVSIISSKKFSRFYEDYVTSEKFASRQLLSLSKYNMIIAPSVYCADLLRDSAFFSSSHQISVQPFAFSETKYAKQNNLDFISFGQYLHDSKPNELKDSLSISYIKFRLGLIGLVNQRKGIRWLIPVLNKFQAQHPHILLELHLFGRLFNTELSTLQSANFKVLSYGHIDFSSTNAYNFFDIQIHPSFFEGSSKAIYDGMYNSKPILCTYESGSIIRDGIDGLIYNAGDEHAFLSHLNLLMTNKELRSKLGDTAFLSSKKYTWQYYSQRICSLYEQSINPKTYY